MRNLKTLLAVLAIAALPVVAQTLSFSPVTVTEVGNYLKALPADFYGIQPAAAKAQIDATNPFILDVREANEYADGHIEKAVLIPIRTLPDQLALLPTEKNTPIILYCGIGHRGAQALVYLKALGYVNVKSVMGGYKAWVGANLPVMK